MVWMLGLLTVLVVLLGLLCARVGHLHHELAHARTAHHSGCIKSKGWEKVLALYV